MSRNLNLIARIPAGLASLLLLAALFLFIDLRPRLPSLPRSFSEPVALWRLEEILVFLAWLAALVLLLALLFLSLRRLLQRERPQVPLVLRRDADRTGKRGGGDLSGVVPRPNPLAMPYVLTIAPPRLHDESQPAATDAAAPAATLLAPRSEERPHEQQQRTVAIRLLGPPAVEGLPRRRRGLRTDCRLFLIYLALHPKGAGRDELVTALWPDVPEPRARQRLYQAAADARSNLGTAFVAEDDRYRLDDERLEIDVEDLHRLLHDADANDRGRKRAALEQALALVHGEPLSGLDLPWADGEARRLRAVVVDLCERLARVRLADGDPAGALAAAERGIGFDELNEELWRLALEAEGVLGLRDGVISRYETLCRVLGERLGLEPQRETRTLYLELLGQD